MRESERIREKSVVYRWKDIFVSVFGEVGINEIFLFLFPSLLSSIFFFISRMKLTEIHRSAMCVYMYV